MSPRYSITPAAAHRDTRVTPIARALLSLLGTYTDRNGWCHPKQTELAASLGCTREYVVRSLRTLVALGYVETRSFTAARRGRVSLEYRVRTDLPDEMVQVAENSRCEPDVMPSSQRPDNPLKTADVIQSSQRGRCEQEITTVRETSLRSVSKNDPKETRARAFPENFVEGWARWPQRGRSSKAKSAEAWARANRAHGAPRVLSAIDAFLGSPDATRDNGQYVPALERWLRDRLETWIELSAGKPAEVINWPRREGYFQETGRWNDAWGPRPDSPEYRGAAA